MDTKLEEYKKAIENDDGWPKLDKTFNSNYDATWEASQEKGPLDTVSSNKSHKPSK